MAEHVHDRRMLSQWMDYHKSPIKDPQASHPLHFDRINEQRPPRSTARLFTMPDYILADVTEYLEMKSLAALALVNRECRQLARSRQFSSVLFDYSDASVCLIKKLLSEGQERDRSPFGTTLRPAIGPCIRRITVTTNARFLCERHSFTSNTELLDFLGEVAPQGVMMAQALAEASTAFFDCYLPDLHKVFVNCKILPHLELLCWDLGVPVGRELFEAFGRPTLKHLKVCCSDIFQESMSELSNMVTSSWSLRTLHLQSDELAPKMFTQILRHSQETLVSLTWRVFYIDILDMGLKSSKDSDSSQPHFPCLRRLELLDAQFGELAMITALLSAKLVILELGIEISDVVTKAIRKRGKIPTLDTFIWNNSQTGYQYFDLLRTNSHLKTLYMRFASPVEFLETALLPLLSKSFTNLHSLRFGIEGPAISDITLDLISTLTSLRQISLFVEVDLRVDDLWLIDHQSLRHSLRRLPHLQKLAICADTYSDGQEGPDYYKNQWYDVNEVALMASEEQAVPNKEGRRSCVWERLHRERMLREANLYVQAIPKLDWLYFGQLQMIAAGGAPKEGGKRCAIVLSEAREEPAELLEGMFHGDHNIWQ